MLASLFARGGIPSCLPHEVGTGIQRATVHRERGAPASRGSAPVDSRCARMPGVRFRIRPESVARPLKQKALTAAAFRTHHRPQAVQPVTETATGAHRRLLPERIRHARAKAADSPRESLLRQFGKVRASCSPRRSLIARRAVTIPTAQIRIGFTPPSDRGGGGMSMHRLWFAFVAASVVVRSHRRHERGEL